MSRQLSTAEALSWLEAQPGDETDDETVQMTRAAIEDGHVAVVDSEDGEPYALEITEAGRAFHQVVTAGDES